MKEISINSQWLPSKVAIDTLANSLVEPVINGELDPLKATATLRALYESLDKALEKVKPYVIDELVKTKEGISVSGTKFQLKEVGVKYDYSNCQDRVYDNLINQLNILKEQIKERETFLKGIKQVEILVDKETGEVYEVQPPIKTSTTSFAITFSKEVSNE